MRTEAKTYEVESYAVREIQPDPYDYRRPRKTRIYVDCDIDLEIGIRPEYSMRGDNPELDKEWDAYNRREVKAMKAIIKKVLGEDVKVYFSRKAGCSCGCSAGFVYNGNTIRLNGADSIHISDKKEA